MAQLLAADAILLNRAISWGLATGERESCLQ
jgi:hypothetical protein